MKFRAIQPLSMVYRPATNGRKIFGQLLENIVAPPTAIISRSRVPVLPFLKFLEGWTPSGDLSTAYSLNSLRRDFSDQITVQLSKNFIRSTAAKKEVPNSHSVFSNRRIPFPNCDSHTSPCDESDIEHKKSSFYLSAVFG